MNTTTNAITEALAAEKGLISSVLAAARCLDDVANGGTLEHALGRLQASAAGAQARIASALARFTAIVGDVAQNLDQAATDIFEDLSTEPYLDRHGENQRRTCAFDPAETATPAAITDGAHQQVEPAVSAPIAQVPAAELPAAVEPAFVPDANPIPNAQDAPQDVQADETTHEPVTDEIATPTAAQAFGGVGIVQAVAACSPVESAKDNRKPAPSAPRPKPTLPAPKPSTTKKGRRRPRPST